MVIVNNLSDLKNLNKNKTHLTFSDQSNLFNQKFKIPQNITHLNLDLGRKFNQQLKIP